MDENTLLIQHQDGNLVYRLEKGGYCLANGQITISVRAKATHDDQFPDCAQFCLDCHPKRSRLSPGDIFDARSDWAGIENHAPYAYGYFSFHAEEVSITWEVKALVETQVLFALTAHHDDVNYYDGRANRNTTIGLFRLEPKPRHELWVPA